MTKKIRKGSIGAKIYFFMLIIALVSIIVVIADTSALKTIGTLNQTENMYVELENEMADFREIMQEVGLYVNLTFYNYGGESFEGIAGAATESRGKLIAAAGVMQETAVKLNDPEILGAVNAAVDATMEYDAYVANVVATVQQGDLGTAGALIGGMYGASTAVGDQIKAMTALFTEKMTKITNQSTLRIAGTTTFNNVCVIIVVITALISIVVLSKTIIKPAKEATEKVKNLVKSLEDGNADLTTRIQVKEMDEIGQLVTAVNTFIEVLQGTITNIKQESENMDYSVEKVNQGIVESNESATNISSTMEEMSASIEEVTATISTVASGSDSILADIRVMSEQIQNGAHLVRDINDRAGEMRDDTTSEQSKINETVAKLREELTAAVEESKKAEKINDLTNDILSITSQTNLLALNASIEAARAGEAGRGFAVVADEIRVLADSSRDTANNIQEISSTVIKAVHKLAEDAQAMLKFIDEDVMSDFDNFVTIVEQYKSDADSMDEIIKSFDENVSTISTTVTAMTESMNDISIAMDENAKGVTNVAESAVDLVNVMSDIKAQAEDNDMISKRLSEEVSKFKQI